MRSKTTNDSSYKPLSKIFFIWCPIDVQFQRRFLNWYSHSLNPMLIPRLISRIISVSFLHISWYLPRNRRGFLHIKYGSNNRLVLSALKKRNCFFEIIWTILKCTVRITLSNYFLVWFFFQDCKLNSCTLRPFFQLPQQFVCCFHLIND